MDAHMMYNAVLEVIKYRPSQLIHLTFREVPAEKYLQDTKVNVTQS